MGRNQLLYTAAEEPVLYFVLHVYVEHTQKKKQYCLSDEKVDFNSPEGIYLPDCKIVKTLQKTKPLDIESF